MLSHLNKNYCGTIPVSACISKQQPAFDKLAHPPAKLDCEYVKLSHPANGGKKKLDLTNHAVWKRTGLRVVGVARVASCRPASTGTLRGTPVSRQPPREQGLLLNSAASAFLQSNFSCHHLILTVGIIF